MKNDNPEEPERTWLDCLTIWDLWVVCVVATTLVWSGGWLNIVLSIGLWLFYEWDIRNDLKKGLRKRATK